MRYLFEEPLRKGIVRSRPNRFVMLVESNAQLLRCRCPSPTKIGKVEFKKNHCLLSTNKKTKKTTHTVEAIKLKTAFGDKCWVGINQTKINAVCKYFMDKGALPRLVGNEKFAHGVKVKKSVIDFASANSLLEIKTPLTVLPSLASKTENYTHSGNYERTIRHCDVLTRHAKSGKRAILLLAYLYSAPPFDPIKQNGHNKRFVRTLQRAYINGVEFWQANFSFTDVGIELIKYSKLRFIF